MSMHKPVSEHGDRHSLGSPGTQTVQKQHAWSLELDAQPSAARIRLPRGRGAGGLCLGAASLQYIPDVSAASGPEPEPARALIPGDGAAGDQEAQNRTACPGNSGYATPEACPVSNDFLTLCSQAHLPPSNRQVRSTSIHMAKPGPGWRSSRSRIAINGHIVFGSNNFRSLPNIRVWHSRCPGMARARRCPGSGRSSGRRALPSRRGCFPRAAAIHAYAGWLPARCG